MRVALIHYWLNGMRGGEKVLESMCRVFPQADIFTLFYEPEKISPLIRSKNVHASFLNPLRRHYRALLPLMPLGLESFDLRPYDLVISSESGPAKGVITSSSTRHICYCHSPMRYLWELYPAYCHDFGAGILKRVLMAPVANYLRTWDYSTAARVDTFAANSWTVRKRVWRVYRRRSTVIHPPVAVRRFQHETSQGYFLMVAEMVAYKRLDYAIRTFAQNGRQLKVVGAGPEYRALRRAATSNVEFCGRVSDTELSSLYARSAALVVPGEEDFGITIVEALASGKPVIALGRGGAAEILRAGCGVLYDEPSERCLQEAIDLCDRNVGFFRPLRLNARAREFSEDVFEQKLTDLVYSKHTPSVEDGNSLNLEKPPQRLKAVSIGGKLAPGMSAD